MVMVNAVSTTTRSLSLTCPDVTDVNGKTLLDDAVECRHTEVEVADMAVLCRCTEVINYLKSHQPSTPEPGMCH